MITTLNERVAGHKPGWIMIQHNKKDRCIISPPQRPYIIKYLLYINKLTIYNCINIYIELTVCKILSFVFQ